MGIWFLVFILLSSFVFAKLEIEIEGEHGWAEKLPTWRVERHALLDMFFGGRPLTGYHVWAFLFVFTAFHLPFFWSGSWSLGQELRVVGGYTLFWIVEDLLWFLFNPHYGWKRFTRENIWWHKRWALGLPVDYWVLGTLALVLLLYPWP